MCFWNVQAQDNVLFSGKIEEYEAAFNLVDTDKKGKAPSRKDTQSFILTSQSNDAPSSFLQSEELPPCSGGLVYYARLCTLTSHSAVWAIVIQQFKLELGPSCS